MNQQAIIALERTGHSKARMADLSDDQKDRLAELSTTADIRLAVGEILSGAPRATVAVTKKQTAKSARKTVRNDGE